MAKHCVKKISKKYERTSQEQLDHYLNFLQENPDFLTNKTDPSKIQNYWDVLTKELNVLRGPVRSAAKWKQVLSHWKHQLRSRARKIKGHENLTGGSPPPLDKISTFQEKALEVLGSVALEGLQTVPTIGCDERSIKLSPATPTSVSSFTFEDTTQFEPESLTTPESSKGDERISTTDLYSKVLELCAKRCEMEKEAREERHQIQLQILKNQEVMAEALRKLGEGVAAISQLLNVIVNRQ